MSWETLAAGQQFAAAMRQPLEAAIAGKGVAALAAEAATKKVTKIHALEHDLLENYTADAFTAAIEQLIRKTNPIFVLFPHTAQVRDFAPKLATRFNQVLVSDVISVRWESGSPVFVRLLFQGTLNGAVRISGAGPYFASLQAGAWRADTLEAGTGSVETFAPTLDAAAIRQRPEAPFRESARALELTAAGIIWSVGRGIQEQGHITVVWAPAQAPGA